MARAFASASSQYLLYSSAGLSSEPLTMAAWVYPLQTNASCSIVATAHSGGADGQYMLALSSGGVVLANKENNFTVSGSASSSTSYSANVWQHVCAVFTSDTSRAAYLNAGGKGTNATSVADPTADNISVGARLNNTLSAATNGYIAHAAIWSAALSDAEVASLYNGGIGSDPRSVRPDALVAYWPLINGDGDQDYWGNFHLTATNSPTYAQHPPVLMRSRPKYVILGAGAPSIATIEIAGTRQVGNTLTCNATSSPSGATFTYQWYMADDIAGTNQTAISGATAQTYELSYANIGAATKLYEGLDSAGEAFIACGATPTKDAVTGDETVSSYVSITEAAVSAPAGSPFESAFIR